MKETLDTNCVKFEQVLPQIEGLFVDCKNYRLFVNEHYLFVQCIILYRSYAIVEKEVVQKE